MISTQGNRLLPIIGGLMALLLVVVMVRSCGTDDDVAEAPDSLDQRDEVVRPDADTAADTIRTLTAEQRRTQERVEETREEYETIREENQALREELQRMREEGAEPVDESRMAGVLRRLEGLSDRVEDLQADDGVDTDLPVGLGLEDEDLADAEPAPETLPRDETDIQWTEPVGWDPEAEDGGLPDREGGVLDRGGQVLSEGADRGREAVGRGRDAVQDASLADDAAQDADEETEEPRYTVPRNSTLMGSTAMTALIGRVPHGGTVEDPVPFKVVVGRDNLAANDIDIPNIDGMIFSGKAMGDWTLSCVRGQIESVTYVFDDGTVRTLPDPHGDTDDALGWISDDRGVPCVEGERVSNAGAYLAQATGIVSLQAAGDAAAAAQTTQIVGQEGFTQNIVSGDTGEFMAGQAVSGAAEEVVDWLRERQENHFDAVFTPAGQTVAVHLDRELHIDYEIAGRRIDHEAFEHDSPHRALD